MGVIVDRVAVFSGLFVVIWCVYFVAVNGPKGRQIGAPRIADAKPLCSLNLFEAVANERQDGVVSGNGTWLRNAKSNAPERFLPSICRLRHGLHIPVGELVQCLRRHSLRRIVVMGDSNGKRYHSAIKDLLATIGAACTITKRDKSIGRRVDKSYYTAGRPPMVPLIAHSRDCSGCSNEQMTCSSLQHSLQIVIERLSAEFTIDGEVTSFAPVCSRINRTGFVPCRAATSSQQFLLRDYLASTPPDLLIVFGNSHDSARFSLREHAMNVRTFLDMIDAYLPASTTVIWTSKPSEYLLRKPVKYRKFAFAKDRVHWLTAANNIQFQEMKKSAFRKNRPHAFMDLLAVSEPVASDWSLDGIHMNSVWYQHIVSYIMQSLCAFVRHQ